MLWIGGMLSSTIADQVVGGASRGRDRWYALF